MRDYTPRHLRDKILAGREALVGERRTVTVLFCDIANSTPLAERLGPEAMHTLLNRFFALALEEVHRLEGTVNQFLGDGFMALFGAPIAHEDSARRATVAALSIHRRTEELAADAAGEAVHLRMGLNTGPVVVGSIGDNLRMDYSAVGDTTNVAARMQQLAEPGTVYLSESTYRAVRDFVTCEPLGALTVKGKTEPIVTYRAVRETAVRTRFEAAAERGLSPFVGRRQELRVLQGYFEQARSERGQVVFVSGEAGIGKSRLLLEFRRRVEGAGARWLEGHCITFGKNIPYLPVIDLVKHAFGVLETDAAPQIVQRVDEAVAAWEPVARATAPHLKYLLNVDPGDAVVRTADPAERRAALFDGLRALLLELARHQPLVVTIEDLHWMDEQSGQALASLVDVVPRLPVLVVLTHRPGISTGVQALGERSYFTRLAVEELPAEESARLASAMLDVPDLPEPLQQFIAGKTEGNPFYVEEVTRTLLEMGALQQRGGALTLTRPVDQIQVPETIQEVILSRIDRLERQAKEALQLAAVIGREFTMRLIQRISDLETQLDDALGQLKALELIYEKGYFPELAYMFKHALTHDVALSTLLTERRKALHRLVGTAIEELYAARLAEHYETLAYHFGEGEEWGKALDYLIKSGDKAAAAYANQDALRFYAQAMDVCELLGREALPTLATIAERRGFLNFTIGDVAAAVVDFERMVQAARALEDRRLEGRALARKGFFQVWHHDFEEGEQTLLAATEVAREGGFDDVRFMAAAKLIICYAIVGRHDALKAALAEAEPLANQGLDHFSESLYMLQRGGLANWAGDFAEAQRWLTPARVAAEQQRQDSARIHLAFHESLAAVGRGEYQQALTLLRDLVAACERIGERVWYARYLNILGWLHVDLQHHDAGLEWNRRSIEAALAINSPDPEIENNARLNVADSLLALGRLGEAEEELQRVERTVRNPRPQDQWALWLYAQHWLHSYGELWLARGDVERALTYAEECLERAERTGRQKNVVKARRLRGQALLALGRPADAERDFLAALALARKVGNPPQLWKTHAAIGALRQAQGRPEDAREAYRAALDVIDAVAAGLENEALRDTFITSAHVQTIRERAQVAPVPPVAEAAR